MRRTALALRAALPGVLATADSGRVMLLVAALLAVASAIVFVLGYDRSEPTQAGSPGPSMALEVFGDEGKTEPADCGGSKCLVVDFGDPFSVHVVATSVADRQPPAYSAYQVIVQYDDSALSLVQQPDLDENVWPDAECDDTLSPPESKSTGRYKLHCESLPTTLSSWSGALVNLKFTCAGSSGQIDLLGGTSFEDSSYYYYVDIPDWWGRTYLDSATKGSKQVADSVTVNCATPTATSTPTSTSTSTPTPTNTPTNTPTHTPTHTPTPTVTPTPTDTATPTFTPTPTKQPDPGDTDGDGCPDVAENGPDETVGGQRDYLNPWDYFNPTKDGTNRSDDIQAVVDHYHHDVGHPDYSTNYDRTYLGPNAWNLGPPNGSIRSEDIEHIVHHYRHDCVGYQAPTRLPPFP